MAWIEVHQSLFTHRKTLELADLLGVPEVYAAAHLIALWSWSLDNAPDGALHVRSTIIARASMWSGDADALVQALLATGYLEQGEGDVLCIHDWQDYAGRLLDKRRANAQRMREARSKEQETAPKERAMHVRSTFDARAGATVPNPTVQNSTIPGESTPAPAQERKLAAVPKAPADKAAKREVKTALPRDFTVTPRMEVWAAEKVPRLSSIDDATEEWLDYCRRENARFSDWEAAWRNAMRRAQEFEESRKGKHNASNNNGRRPGPAERAAETINSAIFG